MTSAEFAEMVAFQKLFGALTPEREDWRAAQITAAVANGYRDHKKRSRPFEPHEFIPDWAKQAGVKRPPSPSTLREKVTGFFTEVQRRGKDRRK